MFRAATKRIADYSRVVMRTVAFPRRPRTNS